MKIINCCELGPVLFNERVTCYFNINRFSQLSFTFLLVLLYFPLNSDSPFFFVFLTPKRNWVFATYSDFIITISLEPNVADLRYFKQWILLDQIIWVWNIKGLQHWVLKILRFKYLICSKDSIPFSLPLTPASPPHSAILPSLVYFISHCHDI